MSIPGTPRLVPVAGGEHQSDEPYPQEIPLPVGVTRLGSPPVAEAVVSEDGLVVLRGLDTVVVDGGPVTETVLVHGNRIALPEGDVVFQAEKEDDDGGRQGGEELGKGAKDYDTLDRS